MCHQKVTCDLAKVTKIVSVGNRKKNLIKELTLLIIRRDDSLDEPIAFSQNSEYAKIVTPDFHTTELLLNWVIHPQQSIHLQLLTGLAMKVRVKARTES